MSVCEPAFRQLLVHIFVHQPVIGPFLCPFLGPLLCTFTGPFLVSLLLPFIGLFFCPFLGPLLCLFIGPFPDSLPGLQALPEHHGMKKLITGRIM